MKYEATVLMSILSSLLGNLSQLTPYVIVVIRCSLMYLCLIDISLIGVILFDIRLEL